MLARISVSTATSGSASAVMVVDPPEDGTGSPRSARWRRISSLVAGRHNAGERPDARLERACFTAAQVLIPSRNGGSPTALLPTRVVRTSGPSRKATRKSPGRHSTLGILYFFGEWV